MITNRTPHTHAHSVACTVAQNADLGNRCRVRPARPRDFAIATTIVDSTRSACHFMRSVSGAWLLCDRTLAVNYVFLIEQTVLFLVVDVVIFRSNGNGPCEWVKL